MAHCRCELQKFCSRVCRNKHHNLKYKAKGNGARQATGETVIKPGTRTIAPLPDHIERPLSVRIDEPDWLKDDLRPPPAGPWEQDGLP